jgi:trans-aconitate 2-methyltransferase
LATLWDASTYDATSQPQQSWAQDVLDRLAGIAPDATVLDVGCGTGLVTERLLELVPQGQVLAIDASADMVELARRRLGARATVWCLSVLYVSLPEPVDVIFSTATLHWVADHDRLWRVLAASLRLGGRLEIQCGGEGNIARVREAIAAAISEGPYPELAGWSPWEFASPATAERRLHDAGFTEVRCFLEQRPTYPDDLAGFVRTSILAAHLERLAPERRDRFCAAVLARVSAPLDYVRLNVSALGGG